MEYTLEDPQCTIDFTTDSLKSAIAKAVWYMKHTDIPIIGVLRSDSNSPSGFSSIGTVEQNLSGTKFFWDPHESGKPREYTYRVDDKGNILTKFRYYGEKGKYVPVKSKTVKGRRSSHSPMAEVDKAFAESMKQIRI